MNVWTHLYARTGTYPVNHLSTTKDDDCGVLASGTGTGLWHWIKHTHTHTHNVRTRGSKCVRPQHARITNSKAAASAHLVQRGMYLEAPLDLSQIKDNNSNYKITKTQKRHKERKRFYAQKGHLTSAWTEHDEMRVVLVRTTVYSISPSF